MRYFSATLSTKNGNLVSFTNDVCTVSSSSMLTVQDPPPVIDCFSSGRELSTRLKMSSFFLSYQKSTIKNWDRDKNCFINSSMLFCQSQKNVLSNYLIYFVNISFVHALDFCSICLIFVAVFGYILEEEGRKNLIFEEIILSTN